MEILAVAIFFSASFIDNYEMLYKDSSLNEFLRYDHFIFVASATFQLLYLIVLFLNWYFAYFEIREGEIIKKSGLIFRSKKSLLLNDIVSVEVQEGPLDRLIKHATIVIENKNGNILKIRNVANFSEYAHIIKQSVASSSNMATDIKSLIKSNEGTNLEFKSTLRFDIKTKTVNKELERSSLKSIVGFLNSKGGTLVIGVKDDGKAIGLKYDCETLSKNNLDGFENHLIALIKETIGIGFLKYIKIKFDELDKEKVCLVSVRSSNKPAYLKLADKKEEFFIRTGNSTQPLSMSETEEYIRNNF